METPPSDIQWKIASKQVATSHPKPDILRVLTNVGPLLYQSKMMLYKKHPTEINGQKSLGNWM